MIDKKKPTLIKYSTVYVCQHKQAGANLKLSWLDEIDLVQTGHLNDKEITLVAKYFK